MVFNARLDLKINPNVIKALTKKTLFFFLKTVIFKAFKKC